MNIPDPIIEKAAKAFWGGHELMWDGRLLGEIREMYRRSATRALTAAYPLIEAEVRAQVASEIRSHAAEHPGARQSEMTFQRGIYNGFMRAARHVQGEPRGYCVCDDGRAWTDCGIPEHRTAARLARGAVTETKR